MACWSCFYGSFHLVLERTQQKRVSVMCNCVSIESQQMAAYKTYSHAMKAWLLSHSQFNPYAICVVEWICIKFDSLFSLSDLRFAGILSLRFDVLYGVYASSFWRSGSIMALALRKVKGNIERLFDKSLTDLVRGIRNNRDNEVRTCLTDDVLWSTHAAAWFLT